MKTFYRLLYCILVLIAISAAAFAGNSGKIVGKVVDEKNQPIIGAIIQVLGTQRGASTDIDGKYEIIGVAVGSYSVRASGLDYDTVTATDVKVNDNQTTPQNFKLTTGGVGLKEVLVTADAKLVNNLSTTGTQTVTSKTIDAIPNVKNVQDVLALQAGVVKSGGSVFLRGGRANEVQYLVDGVPTNDIVNNTSIYSNANSQIANLQASGINASTGGLTVSASAIQSVSVQSSGFDADYGNAQSGIVSITTKSGADSYSGGAQFRTDKIAKPNQDEVFSSVNFGGPEPITRYLLPSLGATIPGNLTFFLSSDVDRNDGPYNYAQNQFFNPEHHKIEFNGFLGGLLQGAGFSYADNQVNTFTLDSKLNYNIGADQATYSYRASLGTNHNLSGHYGYLFFADSSFVSASLSTQHVFAFTHFFSSGTFLKATLGKVEDHNGNDVAGLLPSDYSSATKNTTDPVTGFQYLGSDQSWYSGITQQYSARLDFNSQVHPLHLLKAGFEFYYETINSTDIEDPTAIGHDSLGNPAYPPFTYRHDRGLYPGYGSYRYNLSDYPNHGAAYIQDNIEFSGLNLHVGLRYDYMDIGKQVYYQDWIDAWYGAVNPTGATNGVIQPSWVNNVTNGSTFQYYALHGYVSPRLSIGYPVTDRIVFYFNYGHFLQFPDRTLYFDDAFTYNPNASNVVGNPGLKPQRTVEYESGFEDQFSDDMAFKIHAFYKDIFDYISTIPRGQWNLDVNLDYASARGFDFSVDQAVGGDFKFDATYTYQIAQGRSSNPLATIFNPQFDLPRETRLDWDQNNTFNFFATYSVKPNEEGHLFGLPFFNNYQMALNYDYGSGFPYTPYTPRTTALNVYLHNSSTLPANSTFNFNFRKGFLLANKMNLSATIDILNLLDRKNIAPGAAGFNTFTGGPNSYGDYNPATGLVSSYNSLASYVLPFVFSPPRQILFGVQLNFE